MNIEKELEAVKKRLVLLEKERGLANDLSVLEMDLVLPEADIDGLHFNETKVHAVFEKQDDGWYHSRDILFMSARNTVDRNSRDILTKYLKSFGFRSCIYGQLPDGVLGEGVTSDDIMVSLPRESEGVKRYNGSNCGYWLDSPCVSSESSFHNVGVKGEPGIHIASIVRGIAPAFYLRKGEAE
jgi:hypothetical protein